MLFTSHDTCKQSQVQKMAARKKQISKSLRVQVVLSGFSKGWFCFVQTKTLYRYGYAVMQGRRLSRGGRGVPMHPNDIFVFLRVSNKRI